ncbi:MAG: RluA family pseudouridine synthase, partial [Muribaculaceae bacterium]|nr:RluA family pseudouridine synthase [Muribaculaceae bacterium]
EAKYGSDKLVKVAHRLDQDTSGLLIATFGPVSFKVMQTLFATRQVKKTYIAELEGDYKSNGIPRQGRIELPLSPDWLDRPRQRVDFDGGKEAVTDYEFIDPTEEDHFISPAEEDYFRGHAKEKHSRIIFHPLTGRTHQLRVHAASDLGLGMPIVGDRLYGTHSTRTPSGKNTAKRLHLHAQKIEFTFPIDGNHYCFESPVPF